MARDKIAGKMIESFTVLAMYVASRSEMLESYAAIIATLTKTNADLTATNTKW